MACENHPKALKRTHRSSRGEIFNRTIPPRARGWGRGHKKTPHVTVMLDLCLEGQAQFQQCKMTQAVALGARVKDWHSSSPPTVQGLAPPVTGLSTPPGKQSPLQNLALGSLGPSLKPTQALPPKSPVASQATGEHTGHASKRGLKSNVLLPLSVRVGVLVS